MWSRHRRILRARIRAGSRRIIKNILYGREDGLPVRDDNPGVAPSPAVALISAPSEAATESTFAEDSGVSAFFESESNSESDTGSTSKGSDKTAGMLAAYATAPKPTRVSENTDSENSVREENKVRIELGCEFGTW